MRHLTWNGELLILVPLLLLESWAGTKEMLEKVA
jgi:hypothetical protein